MLDIIERHGIFKSYKKFETTKGELLLLLLHIHICIYAEEQCARKSVGQTVREGKIQLCEI